MDESKNGTPEPEQGRADVQDAESHNPSMQQSANGREEGEETAPKSEAELRPEADPEQPDGEGTDEQAEQTRGDREPLAEELERESSVIEGIRVWLKKRKEHWQEKHWRQGESEATPSEATDEESDDNRAEPDKAREATDRTRTTSDGSRAPGVSASYVPKLVEGRVRYPLDLPARGASGLSRPRSTGDFRVVIDARALSECVRELRGVLRRLLDFVEVGGPLVGTFDGRQLTIIDFLLDHDAEATAGSIRLSFDILDSAERLALRRSRDSSRTFGFIGTWHVHPPGYGSQFSQVDRHQLFQERILINAGEPFATTPKTHLIFDGATGNFRIYTMTTVASFTRKSEEFDDELAREIEERREGGADMGAYYGERWADLSFESYDDMFSPSPSHPIIGFWKTFPFERIPDSFEDVFLENFHRKLNMTKFKYSRVLVNEGAQTVQTMAIERRAGRSHGDAVDFHDAEHRVAETQWQRYED
ncbi:hypothetical protein G6O69_18500 [Pseudenhygromyxa sp. WMMC2535]|uniref:hypothetical protein n=1 Tax=Pseudenhygromyxa sp. WMMC2535 TaxID=2712867 RepID=UPI001555F7CB|nr:hypothetical protein [Pseudenhygromyxa sp. WMMC2535]NVB39840.1 hypothetical protein [Pseudenhygromyxa sp. WMMC2535]